MITGSACCKWVSAKITEICKFSVFYRISEEFSFFYVVFVIIFLVGLQPLVKFKSHLYYEEKDRVAESLKRLQVLPNSKISFFKNGVCQGVAFTDAYAGAYYPAVSLHKNATVTINYGPRFKHPPPKDQFTYNGVSSHSINYQRASLLTKYNICTWRTS